MKYILDFDGVILNTEELKKKMTELGIDASSREASVFERIQQMDPTFNIEHFIFEDARTFLEKHAGNCYIVSSFLSADPQNNNHDDETQRLFQEMKIKLSGVAHIVGNDHVHVVGKSKANMLAELKEQFDKDGFDCGFVDDRKVYVEEAAELGIRSFWMNRKKKMNQFEKLREYVSVNEVGSLSELELLLGS